MVSVGRRTGIGMGPTMQYTMRIVLGVSVYNVSGSGGEADTQAMTDRVLNAILPHPDDCVHTGHGDEKVTVIADMVDVVEVTS